MREQAQKSFGEWLEAGLELVPSTMGLDFWHYCAVQTKEG
jgi:hypothetical protein